jgi:hypothetical protein
MKIKEHDQMMAYLTRPRKILANNINSKKNSHTERPGFAKGTKSDTKPTPKNNKMLEYIDDINIIYNNKKASPADADAAFKRQELRERKLQKHFDTPKYGKYAKQIASPPKPDLPNGHSDWSNDDWLETIDQGGWVDDRKVQVEENLFEKYLELLKGGELLPGTTFEMFEKNYLNFDTDIISKINKRVLEQKKTEGLAALLGVSPDRI